MKHRDTNILKQATLLLGTRSCRVLKLLLNITWFIVFKFVTSAVKFFMFNKREV